MYIFVNSEIFVFSKNTIWKVPNSKAYLKLMNQEVKFLQTDVNYKADLNYRT